MFHGINLLRLTELRTEPGNPGIQELKVFGVVTAVIHQFVKREVPKK